MKKIFLTLSITLVSLSLINYTYAACDQTVSTAPPGATFDGLCYRDGGGRTYNVVSPSSTTSNTTSAGNVSTTSSATSILGDGRDDKSFWEDMQRGNVTFEMIPKIIVHMIEFILGIAGAISIVVIIYGALQMQLSSGILGKSDDKGKKIIIAGVIGFVISISSWFVMTKFVEILITSVGP